MHKRILAGLLAAVLTLSLTATGFAAEVPGAEETQTQALTYEDLEEKIGQSSPAYLTLAETIHSLEVLDYEKMKEDMRDTMNTFSKIQWGMLQLSKLPEELGGVSMNTYTYGQLGEAYSGLEDAFEDLTDGELQQDHADMIRQLEDAQNQILVAAKSLYVALLEMDGGLDQLERSIAAMGRTVQEMELRHARGQISDLQLAEVRNGQKQLVSAKATLERSIRLYTVQLQSLVGMELTGELTLAEVPDITAGQIEAMDYQTDLEQAKKVSYAIYDADSVLADAKEDYMDAGHDYGYNEKRYEFLAAKHTYQAAQHTHAAAVQTFEMSFLTAFTAVGEYQVALEAAQSAYEVEKLAFAAQELKYQQGNLSKNNLLNAQDTLKNAEAAVTTAKHNLFTAYLTYQQAVELGVLN